MRAPYLDDGDVRLYLGDCLDVLAEMEPESVDAVVCDPPYGLEFMGKEWDSFATYAGGNPNMKPQGATVGESSGVTYGYRAKNPRCTRCGKLKRGNGACKCPEPRWDTRTSESAFAFQSWSAEWATEALRVLKPGGHLLAFGGTRTFHRLTCGIEDAGFEIRDCLSWLYGSGFPKSLDVSKAIDKRRDDREDIARVVHWLEARRRESGVTRREVEDHFGTQNIGQALFTVTPGSTPRVATWDQWEELRRLLGFGSEMDHEVWRLNGRKGEPGEAWHDREVTGLHEHGNPIGVYEEKVGGGKGRTAKERRDIPATDAAREWQGWGTALKPGWEPCVVARKPLAGTVAENVQRYGTGAVNVDGCRIAHRSEADRAESEAKNQHTRYANPGSNRDSYSGNMPARTDYDGGSGRWPANVALDERAAAMLDAQSGEITTQRIEKPSTVQEGKGWSRTLENRGPRGFSDTGGASRFFYTAKASRADRSSGGLANNTHPTVKPTDLMRWLVRMVTPPGGAVLDPFAGSGSTLVAARAEGFRAIGIEREEEYAAIIADRLSQLSLFSEAI